MGSYPYMVKSCNAYVLTAYSACHVYLIVGCVCVYRGSHFSSRQHFNNMAERSSGGAREHSSFCGATEHTSAAELAAMASSKRPRQQTKLVGPQPVEFHGILLSELDKRPKCLKYLRIYKCQRDPKTWDDGKDTLMGDILAAPRSPPAFDPTA